MLLLNLGILAHVDAGKTTLTERLLYTTGALAAMGSVDDGSTLTDSLALERQRGITIKSAVASFAIDDVTVNLIDTPGHPDFIAEVERVLSVLDGAVLVVSAVEGVQPQTRVLMRTLQRLRIPTLIFVNKIDRRGAQPERVLQQIAERLTPAVVAMGAVAEDGTRDARFVPGGADAVERLVDALAEHDEALLATYLDDPAVAPERLHAALAAQSRCALLHPVFFGAAITGAGVAALLAGIRDLLPSAVGDADGPVSGTIFKIERGPTGEKIAYVRMHAGTLRVRDRVSVGASGEARVTAISVFERGAAERRAAVSARQIGKLWGLAEAQIGDAVGVAPPGARRRFFAPPTLETVVVPRRPAERRALHAALSQLAEQDPLINLRQDDVRQELFLSLYGEVQKEVIQATLAAEYGVDVGFRETTMICIERPTGVGEALDTLGKGDNPFLATVGLRVEPAPIGSGIEFRLDDGLAGVPLYVYKSGDEFRRLMEETVLETLEQGLLGWQVADCAVTMTMSGYTSPATSARDFRLLTPLVLMAALQQAGTAVCEPMHRFRLELPADSYGRLMPLLSQLHATTQPPAVAGGACVIDGALPAARVHELQQQLPGLSRGEGVLETGFDHYQPVRGTAPSRPRTDNNPLNRKEYLLHVLRRV